MVANSSRTSITLYKSEESSCFATVARSATFEHVTLLFIFANAIWIAVEVDNNPEEQLIKSPAIYQVVEHMFCLFFSAEWFVRFMAYRRKKDCLTDMWFIFDSFLLVLMVAETWVLTVVMLVSNGVSGENLSNITVLRLLRLLRLTRITRLMRAMPEMMFMIQGLVSAMRSVAITLFLIMIMVYVFAIMFVQLTREHTIGGKHFSSVWPAMVTLTVEAILPDQGELLHELSEARWYYGLIFFVFLVLATLTMVNMLIGILCEVACRVSTREKEIMDIEMVEAKLLKIVTESLDYNQDNRISKSEFLDILKNQNACKALHQVGVEATDLVAHADLIYNDDYEDQDSDGSFEEKKLNFNEFMQVILKMRGTNAATIKDITNLKKFIKDDISRLERVVNGGLGVPSRGVSGARRGSSASLIGRASPRDADSSAQLVRSRGLGNSEESDSHEPPQVAPRNQRPSTEGLDSAASAEIRDLSVRMSRVEALLERVLEGQQQMTVVENRTVFGSVKQASTARLS
mmetsp:Transcript_48400/g.144548  ORF Transcript_48400/g.144548 Transcript_48400/m.144548 type:complete len:517 (-) Transcript_48400:267-1817(-)